MARNLDKPGKTTRANKAELNKAKKKVALDRISSNNFERNTTGEGLLGVGKLRTRPDLAKKDVVKYYYFLIQDEKELFREDDPYQYYFYCVKTIEPISREYCAKQIGRDVKEIFPLTEDEYLTGTFEHPTYINQQYENISIYYREVPLYEQITPGRMDDMPVNRPAFDYTPDSVVTRNELKAYAPVPEFYASGFDEEASSFNIPAGGTVQFIDNSLHTPPQIRPTTWSWSFGGDFTSPTGSTAQNPVVDFSGNLNGSFSVSLTSTNQYGSNSITKADYAIWNDANPDATSFFAAVEGVTGAYLPASEKQATTKLYNRLQNGSVNFYEDYIGAFWPFIGGAKQAAKYELKRGFDISWGSAVEDKHFNKYGFNPEGITNCVGDTGYNPSQNISSIDDCGLGGQYALDVTFPSQYVVFGCTNGSDRFRITDIQGSFRSYGQLGGGVGDDAQYATSDLGTFFGLKLINRSSNTSLKYFQDGVEVAEETTPSEGLANANIYVGGQTVSQLLYKGRIGCCFVLKKALTDDQALEFSNIVNDWLIEMERYIEPTFYSYFGSLSKNDDLYMEGVSLGWYNSGMTGGIWNKLHVANMMAPSSQADALINMKSPGTFDGTFVNSPVFRVDGFVADYQTEQKVNSNFTANDFTDERNAFVLVYIQEKILGLISGRERYFGSWDGANGFFLQVTASGSTYTTSYNWGGPSTSLYTWDINDTEVKGAIGVNCYDRGSGPYYMKFYHDGQFVGDERITGARSSTEGLHIGSRNDGAGAHENTYPGYAIGEDLTDDEALIVADWFEKSMTIMGRSAYTGTPQTEDIAYYQNAGEVPFYMPMTEGKAKGKLIQELVNSGIWAECDLIHIYATLDQSDENLITGLKEIAGLTGAAVVNTITRDADGIEGNGVDMSINTGYDPSADATNLTLSDNSWSFYTKNNSTIGSIGGIAYTTRHFEITQQGGTTKRWRSFDNLGSVHTFETEKDSVYAMVRTSDNNRYLYKDGAVIASQSLAPTSLPTGAKFRVSALGLTGGQSSAGATKTSSTILGSSDIQTIYGDDLKTIHDNYFLRLKGYDIDLSF